MDTIPKKGKRYRLQSRPWDSSYLDIIEDDEGEWIFYPISVSDRPTSLNKKEEENENKLSLLQARSLLGFCPKIFQTMGW